MTLRQLLHTCVCALAAATAGTPLLAQEHAGSSAWSTTKVNEVEYYSLEHLRSFYKLRPIESSAQHLHTIGNSSFRLTFNTAAMEVLVAGYRCRLSHPIVKNADGELMISKTDFVKLIDPLLRPTYISERREVRTVVIDPGHGGTDYGNRTEWLTEADCTLAIALDLARELEKRGLHVILTRNMDRDLADSERVRTAREAPAAIFISLHVNSGRSDIRGIETYTAAPAEPNSRPLEANRHDAANMALAFTLHTNLLTATKATDGGCRRVHYSLLNTVNCPAALVQVGYGTHQQEATNLSAADYRAEIVTGLANGIASFCATLSPKAQITPSHVEEPPPPAAPKQPAPSTNKDKSTPKNTGKGSSGKSSSKGASSSRRSSGSKSSGKTSSSKSSSSSKKSTSKPATRKR